jgi:opacity protein-like surface antigen
MSERRSIRSVMPLFMLALLFGGVFPSRALAQGFISPSFGYNFGGDAGCLQAIDCEDKNWNFGVSMGALGSVVGFEAELTYEGEFLGNTPTETSKVMTLMANFMLAPKITVVQPYGLVGIGLIRTAVEDILGGTDEAENQIGWTIGGGVIVFVHRHVGLKGDIRYYHSFEALDLFGVELARDENRLDFGRAAFGVVFAF